MSPAVAGQAARPVLHVGGWRRKDGAPLDAFAGFAVLSPLLCQLEGYGIVERQVERGLSYA